MKKIIIANWKMNSSFDEAQIWVENLTQKLTNSKNSPEIILCPPAVMIDHIDGILIEQEFEKIEKLQNNVEEMPHNQLEKLIEQLRVIKLGGQDCSSYEKGAFTGDISAKMLNDCGAWYVILGHSERRQNHNESSVLVSQKVAAAVANNLIPILCVGESWEKRNDKKFADFIIQQLRDSLPQDLTIANLIIAYEPIWAIGSGLIPSAAEIAEVMKLIKEELSNHPHIKAVKIIYGGSVNSQNAAEILNIENVDGLLVGGASLDCEEFLKIISYTKS